MVARDGGRTILVDCRLAPDEFPVLAAVRRELEADPSLRCHLVRWGLIERLRAAIADETYTLDDKIDVVIERMWEDLCAV